MHDISHRENEVLSGQSFPQRIRERITNKKSRVKMLRLLAINMLLFTLVYFAFVNFKKMRTEEMITAESQPSQKETVMTLEENNIKASNLNKVLDSSTVLVSGNQKMESEPIFNIAPVQPKKQISEKLIKHVFKVNSNNPQGFYIMVGSFGSIDNAEAKQEENPTDFTCYIFYPKNNKNARVGLFISEDDKSKAIKVLKNVKKMQPDSWLLYNFMD